MGYADDSTILIPMADNPGALEGFVEQHVKSSLQSLRTPEKVPSHEGLLRKALQWRRVEIRDVNETSRVFVFGGNVIGGMDRRVTTLVSAHARRIAGDEALTRKHLQLQSVPMPAAPEAAAAVSEDPAAAEQPVPADGLDIRAFVVGNQVVGAVAYVPLSALQALLDADRLEALRRSPAGPQDGIAVDVTEVIDNGLADLAVDALWSVPGLAAGAVDLLAPQLETAEGAVVLGLDVEASVVPHHLPALGEPRDVAGAIADQLLLQASR